MSTFNHYHRVYVTVVVGMVILVVGAVLVNQVNSLSHHDEVTTSPSPSSSPIPKSPTPSVVASPTIQATGAPGLSALFPVSGTTFLANFYAAYNQEDRARLATYFTPDTNQTDLSMHTHLFTNKDTTGVTGGPYLFVDGPASSRSSGYSLIREAQQGAKWIVTVLEQRIDMQGAALAPSTTILTLVPSANPTGSWLIDSYVRTAGDEKYSAFLTN